MWRLADHDGWSIVYSFEVACASTAKVDGLASAYVDGGLHKLSNRTSLLRISCELDVDGVSMRAAENWVGEISCTCAPEAYYDLLYDSGADLGSAKDGAEVYS